MRSHAAKTEAMRSSAKRLLKRDDFILKIAKGEVVVERVYYARQSLDVRGSYDSTFGCGRREEVNLFGAHLRHSVVGRTESVNPQLFSRSHVECFSTGTDDFRGVGTGMSCGKFVQQKTLFQYAVENKISTLGFGNISDLLQIIFQEVAADAVVRDAEESDVLSVTARTLKEGYEISMYRHHTERIPVVRVAFEVFPHSGVVVAVGLSCIDEVVFGATLRSKHE